MGKKRQNVERVTLTVPANIRRQMRKRDNINWSNVAARAFSNHLEAETDLEFHEGESGAAAKWATHRRSLIKAALSEIRDSSPMLRPAMYTLEGEDHDSLVRDVGLQELGVRIGKRQYAVTICRPDREGGDNVDFVLTFNDDECESFGGDWPALPADPKKLYEIVELAGRSTLWLSPFKDPEPGVALLGLRRSVPSLSITGRALLELHQDMGVSLAEIKDVLTGERTEMVHWDNGLAMASDE